MTEAFPLVATVRSNPRLDFAASPNRYRPSDNGDKSSPPRKPMQRIDLSPRLMLSLSLQCESIQAQDGEAEESINW